MDICICFDQFFSYSSGANTYYKLHRHKLDLPLLIVSCKTRNHSQTTHKPAKYWTNHPLINQKSYLFSPEDIFFNCSIFLGHPALEEKQVHSFYVPATIIFIFWNFLMFYQTFFSPQVKRCTITIYTYGIYEFLHDLPKKNSRKSENIIQ